LTYVTSSPKATVAAEVLCEVVRPLRCWGLKWRLGGHG
jgi:hypothetical protein